jgi:competence protein ComEC
MRSVDLWLFLIMAIAGLLVTGGRLAAGIFPVGGLVLAILGLAAALVVPRLWRSGPSRLGWMASAVVAALASFYLVWRLPQPGPADISRIIQSYEGMKAAPVVTVRGRLIEPPRLTRSDRVQFWLQVQYLVDVTGQTQDAADPEDEVSNVTGRLYTTVPLLQGTGLYPNQEVEVTGTLYKPKPALYTGGFDFAAYLAQQDSYAGLAGYQLSATAKGDPPSFGWGLRQRLIRGYTEALGSPGGPLLSAIVLGSRGVDLPYDVRDGFARVGLAHTIAVSGFHVSMILGFVLALLRRFSAKVQFGAGAMALLGLLAVTGVQPSVLRAVVMGFAALAGLVIQRKVKPLGSLGVAACVLLVISPLWIWDLGFQLSCLATFGLLTTATPIAGRLRWMPTLLADLIAVPLAATLWTLPLQLYQFGVLSPYSLLANVVSSPLVYIVSVGGFVSAGLMAIAPSAGIVFTQTVLQMPVRAFLGLAEKFNQLPGAGYATGSVSLVQLGLLYGLMLLLLVPPKMPAKLINRLLIKLRSSWIGVGILMGLIVALPLWHLQLNRFQVTVLGTQDQPILIIQNRNQVGLINCGDEQAVQSTLLPFLQHQGTNQLRWAIATHLDEDSRRGWIRLLNRIPVQDFYEVPSHPPTAPPSSPDGVSNESASSNGISNGNSSNTGNLSNAPTAASLNATQATAWSTNVLNSAVQAHTGRYSLFQTGQNLSLGSQSVLELGRDNTHWTYRYGDIQWLWLLGSSISDQRHLLKQTNLPIGPVNILWWSGEPLEGGIITRFQPQVAIASSQNLDPDTMAMLQAKKVNVFWTGRDGALQWSPKLGILSANDATEIDRGPL